MINYEIMETFKEFVPEGKRSDFINNALDEALKNLKNQIAFDEMEKMRLENPISMTTEEIIEAKNYGRK